MLKVNKEINIAYSILKKVTLDKSYVSIELNKYLENSKNVNNALITKIVYGVLEKDITLEYFVAQNVSKMPKDEIKILLKMVAYISKTIDSIPPFALVNEIVEIAKRVDKYSAGFVNAVSKKLISKQIMLPPKREKIKYLSVKYNYPEWVIIELLKSHDEAFVESLISEELTTMTHIRVNRRLISPKEFKIKLELFEIK